MEKLESRTPPSNVEAEAGLLGSMLLAAGDLGEIFETLSPDHFYARRHQVLFRSICEVYEDQGSVDTILLRDRLDRAGLLDDVGGLDYLLELSETVRTTANAHRYAEIVRDRALIRRLIETCGEIIEEGYESPVEATTLVDRAEQRIFEIAEHRRTHDVVSIGEAIKSTFDLIDHWHKGNTGLPTGYSDLDGMTNGLQPSELIVVAGRPSMGKTTLAMNIAQNASLVSKVPVAIFSLEVDSRQLVMNLLCGTAKINSQGLRSGSLGK